MIGYRMESLPGCRTSAPAAPPGWTSAHDPAVELSPARPELRMPNDTLLERFRLERALMALDRRTAGREPTRDERRLRDHYTRQLRALDPDEGLS